MGPFERQVHHLNNVGDYPLFGLSMARVRKEVPLGSRVEWYRGKPIGWDGGTVIAYKAGGLLVASHTRMGGQDREVVVAPDDARLVFSPKGFMIMGPFESRVHGMHLLEAGGQAAGLLEIDRTPLQRALSFTLNLYHDMVGGRTLGKDFPDFEQNYLLAQNKATKGRTRRRDMPVIDSAQVRSFQARIKEGSIDVRAPFAPATDPKNPFPEGLTGKEAQEFVHRGLDDGNPADDRIKVSSASVPAKNLKPIQKQIFFDKSIVATVKAGPAKARSFLTKALMIMSEDNFIIDGHHRWASALIIDPSMVLTGIKIALPIAKLLPLTLAYGDAIGNRRNA